MLASQWERGRVGDGERGKGESVTCTPHSPPPCSPTRPWVSRSSRRRTARRTFGTCGTTTLRRRWPTCARWWWTTHAYRWSAARPSPPSPLGDSTPTASSLRRALLATAAARALCARAGHRVPRHGREAGRELQVVKRLPVPELAHQRRPSQDNPGRSAAAPPSSEASPPKAPSVPPSPPPSPRFPLLLSRARAHSPNATPSSAAAGL